MSYRQTNKREEALWRKSNRERLLAAGLSESVVDNEKNWNYLLLHGNDEFQSGWNVNWINHQQAQELLELLRSQTFWPETGHDIFAALQRKVKEYSKT